MRDTGPLPERAPARRDREEVNRINMRKTFAVSMIAILSLMFALAVIGCAKKASETSTTPPAEQTPAPAESSSMMTDTTHHDTTGMKQ